MSEADVPTEQPQTGEEPRVSPPDVDPGRAGHHQSSSASRPAPPVGLIWRVDRLRTFEALRKGCRGRCGPITVSWVPSDPGEPPRVAYAIGRRVGSAVVRNRVRRRLRMLIRDEASALDPGAYLIGVGPAAAALPYEDLRTTLLKALRSIEKA
jgi:ribonuclease P protein component